MITYTPIGRVENGFSDPVAAQTIRSTESRIVLNPEYADGLSDVVPGHALLVLFHCHRSHGYELRQHPRGDRSQPRKGVFALRSPRRPNPIGATVVDVAGIEGNVLHVRGLDALNDTPVLDLKPAQKGEGA